jgi:hypothetical protein
MCVIVLTITAATRPGQRTLIGEHEVRRRVIALDQILLSCGGVTPDFTQLVPEARQNSSTRSGTVRSAAIISVVGVLASLLLTNEKNDAGDSQIIRNQRQWMLSEGGEPCCP